MNRTQKVGIALGGVILAAVLLLGYFGFVPMLSDLMGVNKERDLGVKYTDADYDSAISKLGITLTVGSSSIPEDSIVLQGSDSVDVTLNSAELTSFINKLDEKWDYFPMSNTQIRINNDDTVEVQGTFLMDRFYGFAQAMKLSESVKSQIAIYTSLIKTNPSAYMRFSLSVNEYNVQSNLDEIKIGNFNISSNELTDLQNIFNNYFENMFEQPSKVDIRTMTFGNKMVHIVGNLPTEISLSPP